MPSITSEATRRWSYAVAPAGVVAVVVMTVVPKAVGTVTSKAPEESAVAAATALGAPVSVFVASTTTREPGAVVPVTCVVAWSRSSRRQGP